MKRIQLNILIVTQFLASKLEKEFAAFQSNKIGELQSVIYNYLDDQISIRQFIKQISSLEIPINFEQNVMETKKIEKSPVLPISKFNIEKRTQKSRGKIKKQWTQNEDIRLLAGIVHCGLNNWKSISKIVGNNRNPSSCSQR